MLKKRSSLVITIAAIFLLSVIVVGYLYLWGPIAISRHTKNGIAYLQIEDYKNSIHTLEKANKLNKQDNPVILYPLGQAFFYDHQYNNAVEAFSKVIASKNAEPDDKQKSDFSQDFDFFPVYYSLAESFAYLNDIESAQATIEEGYAVTQNPSLLELSETIHVKAPDSNYKSSSYNGIIRFSFNPLPKNTTLYYTLDGTEPSANATMYQTEFDTALGNNIIKAISINKYGIASAQSIFRLQIFDAPGNRNGNIVNSAIVVTQGNSLYYSDGKGIQRISAENGQPEKIVDGVNLTQLNTQGEWLYFVRSGNQLEQGIYKVRLDGSALTKISNDPAEYMQVVQGRIYYTLNAANPGLYTLDLNGEGKTSIVAGYISILNYDTDHLYFIMEDPENTLDGVGSIYSLSITTGQFLKVLEENVQFFQIENSCLYYVTDSDKYTEEIKILTLPQLVHKAAIHTNPFAKSFLIDKENVFYFSFEDGAVMQQTVNPSGLSSTSKSELQTLVVADKVEKLNAADGFLYGFCRTDEPKCFKTAVLTSDTTDNANDINPPDNTTGNAAGGTAENTTNSTSDSTSDSTSENTPVDEIRNAAAGTASSANGANKDNSSLNTVTLDDTTDDTISVHSSVFDITFGTIKNMLTFDNKVYFTAKSDNQMNIYRYTPDDSAFQNDLIEINAQILVRDIEKNEQIVYANNDFVITSNGNHAIRYSLKETELDETGIAHMRSQKLTDPGINLFVGLTQIEKDDDKLYFVSEAGFFRADADFRTVTFLCDDGPNNREKFQIRSGSIFYLNRNSFDKNGLYVMDLDGNNKKMIIEGNIKDFYAMMSFDTDFNDLTVYYINQDDYDYIYHGNIRTEQKVLVKDVSADKILVENGSIFYRNTSDRFSIYQLETDGSAQTMLINGGGSDLNILNDFIYYSNWLDSGRVYRTNIFDGYTEKIW